ncbi:response regulator [Miltoncostaea marina]|uniref:response regulator n=1 Tax=Miltoncostaea marina TaxID=2843215 RepID=UPI001C3D5B4B|nr:response regulator transcription factor [Miltoncostaea marina]
MRVLLADDHSLFRAGVASLLRAWGMEVVGQAGDGLEAIALTRRLRPDLILMDIDMPRCGGLQATRLIKAELPDVRIVIVTVSDEDDHLFEAVRSGAEGYMLKGMDEEELERTLDAIAAGEPALSPALAARVLDEFARLGRAGQERTPDGPELTPRETDVLRHVAAGATNREVAAALVVSEHTVNFHMKNILHKLHLRNRAQAVAYAIRTGLLTGDPEA